MWDPPTDDPLRRMFSGLAEHAFFTTLGVADPPLIDYVSALLSRFVHLDTVYRLRAADGLPLTEVVDMLLEAEGLPDGGRTKREFFRHVGDFALFWTGVYPEWLDRNRSRRASKDSLIDYTVQGKRSYLIASAFEDERYRQESPVLRRLSENFELCAYGLREVRREWEQVQRERPQTPGGGLIQ